jgi:hypothetical protein
MEDFKNQNKWVNVGNSASYIPTEYEADEESLNSYINEAKGSVTMFNRADGTMSQGKSYSIVNSLMESKGLDSTDPRLREAWIENNISVAPSSDYSRNKKLEIMYKDEPTGEYLDITGYKSHRAELADRKELEAIESVKAIRGGTSRSKPGPEIIASPYGGASRVYSTPEMIKKQNRNAQALGITNTVKELFKID